MGWPHFLNIGPALIAAAIAIPALLILYFLKLRRREMLVSSTILWKKAIQDLQVNAPFQRLRRNLLLFLQLLLLILLVLALSRPITNMRPGAGKMAVILVDRSASMAALDIDGKSRLNEAKKRAKELVGTLGRDSTAMVIAFDDKAETVQPFTTDTAALRKAIDDIKQTDRPTKLKLAYQLAEAQSNFNPEQLRSNLRPDVWLYSDGKALDAKELNLRGELHYDPIGSQAPDNIGIVALSAKRNYERPTEVQVFGRLASYGPKPVKTDVQLSVAVLDPDHPNLPLDFQISRVAGASLIPENWSEADREKAVKDGLVPKDSFAFKLDLTTAAVIKVEQMRKEGDVLVADDMAQVVVPPPKPLRALLVTDGNYFLELALNSLNLQQPQVMLPSAYEAAFNDEKTNPAQFDVIIFDAYKPTKLPPAGNFIHIGSLPDNLKLKIVKEDAPAPGNAAPLPVDAPISGVLDWKRDHPILKHLSLGKVHVGRLVKLQIPLESEVLVEGMRGPLIVLHREGKSTHLVLSFDLWQSNWPRLLSFPVFMQNAMQFLAIGSQMDVRQAFSPGMTPRIPRANLERITTGTEGLKQIALAGPTGSQKLSIPEAGDFALPSLDKVGLYQLDPPVPQYEQLAVNLLDPNESDLAPSTTPPGSVGETLARATGRSRLELWWWIIACAALPLLFIEWWVYTRRVHL